MDLSQIVGPHLVQLVRAELRRGVLAGEQRIDLVAIGHRPDARIPPRMTRQIVGQEVEHALERGVDDLDNRLSQASSKGLGLRRRRAQQRRFVEGRAEERAQLRDHPLDGDGRRGACVLDAIAQRIKVLVHVAVEGAIAGDQLLDVLGRVGWMPVEQLQQPHLGAVHLVDAHFVQPQPQGVETGLDGQSQHVPGDAILDVERHGGERLEPAQHRAQVGLLLGAAARSNVRQAVVVAVVAQEGGQDWISAQNAFPVLVCQVPQRIGCWCHGHSLGLRCGAEGWPTTTV